MRIVRSCIPAALLLVTASCTGDTSGGDPPEVTEAAPARVRRITRAEYDNSVYSIVKNPTPVPMAQLFAPEDTLLGFTTHDRLQVTPLLADQLDSAAERNWGPVAVNNLASEYECAAGKNEEDCARAFIRALGARAFRRPVVADEEADLLALWNAVRKDTSPKAAAEYVIQAVLTSASFLYRTELGETGAPANKVVWLTQQEIASSISFAITGAPPDTELTAAAAAGVLKSADVRESHARRLLKTKESQQYLQRFVIEWLGLSGLESINKNNQVFPDFSVAFKDSSRTETLTFINHVLANEGASIKELLGANYTFADGRMSLFYGTTLTPDGTTGRVPLPANRVGILTHASVLTTYALFDSSSPIRRGKFVLTRLLCREVPPPPPSIIIIPPAVDPTATTRARFAAHTNNPACAGCHRDLDPIGFGMEDYDGLGKYRTEENGLPVDANGSVVTEDGTHPFTGGAALARFLSESPDVANCVPLQLFRYVMGRDEDTVDARTLEDMRRSFRADPKLKLGDALVALVRSPYFVHRRTTSPE
ncbi:DUF1592 domain-containing protein [Myxococcus sp. K38C18041901]|uniref:DUF1588 domain-containing protein n=1 Tax=Myxococcus guangdongensis TaxID=2906760 RepID=UPI0020A710A9|nr:DUF1588 domain-containing protein [Myxococcus guangdongensis]MCP3057865.1 DUF1592 domain-containing protein [Myxococcus guangdongensis]